MCIAFNGFLAKSEASLKKKKFILASLIELTLKAFLIIQIVSWDENLKYIDIFPCKRVKYPFPLLRVGRNWVS